MNDICTVRIAQRKGIAVIINQKSAHIDFFLTLIASI